MSTNDGPGLTASMTAGQPNTYSSPTLTTEQQQPHPSATNLAASDDRRTAAEPASLPGGAATPRVLHQAQTEGFSRQLGQNQHTLLVSTQLAGSEIALPGLQVKDKVMTLAMKNFQLTLTLRESSPRLWPSCRALSHH